MHTVSVAASVAAAGPRVVDRWPLARLRALAGPRGWASTAYLVLGGLLGTGWLVLLVVGFLVGGATAVLGVGLVVIFATLALARALAELERHLINALLGADVPAPAPVPVVAAAGGPEWRDAARRLLREPRTWRSLAWLLFRAGAGLLVLAGMASCAVVLVALLVLPFDDAYLVWDLGGGVTWRSTAGWASAWALPVGLAGLLALALLVGPLAAVHVRVARLLLGPDPDDQLEDLRIELERSAQRAGLARDLHDTIGHALTLVVVQAEAARTVGAPPDRSRAALAAIAQAARTALDDLDAALAILREEPAVRRPEPTLAELPDLLDRARGAGLPVVLARLDPPARSHPASAVGYRVVQEACTNVLRHAGAAATTVDVTADGPLAVVVRNALPRTAAEPARAGRGLAGLAERVRLAGGEFSAGPTGDGHWLVRARLPAAPPTGRRAGRA